MGSAGTGRESGGRRGGRLKRVRRRKRKQATEILECEVMLQKMQLVRNRERSGR